jgi:hypothetical protein
MGRPKFIVIRDSREQNGWEFPEGSEIAGTVVGGLKTGDYAIQGFEHLLCIERKASITEFAQNAVVDRFKNELLRMVEFPFRFLIGEFTYDDVISYPNGPTVPYQVRKNARISGKFLMRFISDIEVNYGISVILAGSPNNAKYIASNIMKRVYETTPAQ